MHCPCLKQVVINETAHIFITQWCIFVNNILKGQINDNYSNYIYNDAKRMSVRYNKIKNKKKYRREMYCLKEYYKCINML